MGERCDDKWPGFKSVDDFRRVGEEVAVTINLVDGVGGVAGGLLDDLLKVGGDV